MNASKSQHASSKHDSSDVIQRSRKPSWQLLTCQSGQIVISSNDLGPQLAEIDTKVAVGVSHDFSLFFDRFSFPSHQSKLKKQATVRKVFDPRTPEKCVLGAREA